MFERARAAGLPMLGGVDFYVTSAGQQLRAHYWAAQQPALDPAAARRIPTIAVL